MKRPLTLSIALVLSAAGFAAASIVAGGSLAAVTRELTHGMWTTRTNVETDTTSTDVGGRGVVICHRHGHHRYRTLVIADHAVSAHLRHGDTIGYCSPGELGIPGLRHGHGHSLGDANDNTVAGTTTQSTTTSSPFTSTDSNGSGFASGHHGHGDSQGDSQGDDQGDQGDGGGLGTTTTSPTPTTTVSGFTSTQVGGSGGGGDDGQGSGSGDD